MGLPTFLGSKTRFGPALGHVIWRGALLPSPQATTWGPARGIPSPAASLRALGSGRSCGLARASTRNGLRVILPRETTVERRRPIFVTATPISR